MHRAFTLVALELAVFGSRAEPYTGLLFDTYLHYNEEAAAPFPSL